MKYRIIRILDIAGLRVFEPVVRLFAGEEPFVQLKKIGLFLLIPVATFFAFLAGWSYVGPRHKTKSGEVPGPMTVVAAWNGIVRFADREAVKGADFQRDGADRDGELEGVREQLARVQTQLAEVNAKFAQMEATRDQVLAEKLAVYQAAMAAKQEEFAAAAAQRRADLQAQASEVDTSSVSAKQEYLAALQDHLAQEQAESDRIKAMRAEIEERRQEKWTALEAVRTQKNALDQTRQFLEKRITYLTTANRGVKVAAMQERLDNATSVFLSATGPDMFDAGVKVVRTHERLQKVAESKYAQPPTFFMQIRTSLACVFLGFLIATAIAVPIGVLCGLSPVFMSAMTPLISLFKPVSPIVWLPIVFIIVGGFEIPDVEGSMSWLTTPSFLASAVTVALCSLWPTLVNTALGVASIDRDHLNVARVLRLGFWSRLIKIVIPSALPLIFTGLRISLGVGWMVLIAAELLSSSPGLGKFVWDMFNNGSSETFSQMFVVVFVVGLIGMALDRLMIVLQRLVSFDGAPTAL